MTTSGERGRTRRAAAPFALAACVLGLVSLGLLASAWLLNPVPAGAACDTTDGYAAIKSHAETNSSLALLALSSAVIGAVVSIVGALTATGRRMEFALGVVPFVGLGFFSLILLIASGLYCQN